MSCYDKLQSFFQQMWETERKEEQGGNGEREGEGGWRGATPPVACCRGRPARARPNSAAGWEKRCTVTVSDGPVSDHHHADGGNDAIGLAILGQATFKQKTG